MNGKHYVGRHAKSVTVGVKQPPISKVILNGDNDAVFTVGDDSGKTFEVYVPTATQSMAADIFNKVKGFQYQGYTANNAFIPPTVELGDGITVNGVYGVLAKREFSFTPKMTETIGAPYETEEDHEYQYTGNYAKDIANKVQLGQLYYGTRISRRNGIEIVKTDGNIEKSRVTLNSDTLAFYNDDGQEAFYFDSTKGVFRLTQYANVEDAIEGSQAYSKLELTAQQLQLEINDAKGNISSLQQTASSLQTQITNVNGDISYLEQTATSLQVQINSVDGNISSLQQTASSLQSQISNTNGSISSLIQTIDSFELSVSNGTYSSTLYLSRDGLTVSSANIEITGMVTFYDLSGNGTSIINGANITTGTIRASYVGVDGQFAVYNGNTMYGYMGCGYGSADYITTYGVKLSDTGGSNYVIVTNEGVRMQSNAQAYYVTSSGCYATTAVAVMSDRHVKSDIEYDLNDYKQLIRGLRPCKFKLVNEAAQLTHLGFIAQEVEDALSNLSIQPSTFAGLIHDSNDRYFIRYEEFMAGAIALIQELDERLKKLEVKYDA